MGATDSQKKATAAPVDHVKKMLAFIKNSPTCYHAVENVGQELETAGYGQLQENERWELAMGGKYYVTRNGSSLIAFQLPARKPKGFHMVASHSDSPCFKVKENPEMKVEDAYVKLNVEKYGGSILSTWLDRPLSVAGRVVLAGGAGIRNVAVDRDLVLIPNVAIHMNRDMNKGVEYNVQTDMLPLYAGADSKPFLTLMAEEIGVSPKDILGSDFLVYNREKG